MSEHRHHDREADEQGQGSDEQGDGDDEAPNRHRHRVRENRPYRRLHRRHDADVPVQKQREGHHAESQHDDGEEEAGKGAPDDERPAGGCGEDLAGELFNRLRRRTAEGYHVDGPRRTQPRYVDRHQHGAEHRDGADRRGSEDVEGMPPGDIEALLAAPAQLVHADRDQRADQGESGKEREDQRQHVVSGVSPGENESDDGIYQAQENDVGRHRLEVIEALGQSVYEVRRADSADIRFSGPIRARVGDRLFIRHGRAS